jgi:hypothetical protein
LYASCSMLSLCAAQLCSDNSFISIAFFCGPLVDDKDTVGLNNRHRSLAWPHFGVICGVAPMPSSGTCEK